MTPSSAVQGDGRGHGRRCAHRQYAAWQQRNAGTRAAPRPVAWRAASRCVRAALVAARKIAVRRTLLVAAVLALALLLLIVAAWPLRPARLWSARVAAATRMRAFGGYGVRALSSSPSSSQQQQQQHATAASSRGPGRAVANSFIGAEYDTMTAAEARRYTNTTWPYASVEPPGDGVVIPELRPPAYRVRRAALARNYRRGEGGVGAAGVLILASMPPSTSASSPENFNYDAARDPELPVREAVRSFHAAFPLELPLYVYHAPPRRCNDDHDEVVGSGDDAVDQWVRHRLRATLFASLHPRRVSLRRLHRKYFMARRRVTVDEAAGGGGAPLNIMNAIAYDIAFWGELDVDTVIVFQPDSVFCTARRDARDGRGTPFTYHHFLRTVYHRQHQQQHQQHYGWRAAAASARQSSHAIRRIEAEYAYLGAVWPHAGLRLRNARLRYGNGGVSIRSREFVMRCLLRATRGSAAETAWLMRHNEDYFFSWCNAMLLDENGAARNSSRDAHQTRAPHDARRAELDAGHGGGGIAGAWRRAPPRKAADWSMETVVLDEGTRPAFSVHNLCAGLRCHGEREIAAMLQWCPNARHLLQARDSCHRTCRVWGPRARMATAGCDDGAACAGNVTVEASTACAHAYHLTCEKILDSAWNARIRQQLASSSSSSITTTTSAG